MFSITENYEYFATSKENAILLCDDKRILQSQTYEDVMGHKEVIIKMLKKYISKQNICLGLFMNHNIHIPSIIISLLELGNAFMFLTGKNLDRNLANLKFEWILSSGDIKEIRNYKEIHSIIFDHTTLVLWCRDSLEIDDFNYQNIFCVIQSSGSTGENKIIKVPHACIEVNVLALRNLFKVNSEDVIYWGTPLTFDPSLVELLLSLQTGASLVIVPSKISTNPYSLYRALFVINEITVLQMVPSVFLRWHENQIMDILNSTLKVLALGGEHFPKCILNFNRSHNLKLFNLYGISEVSCWATAHEIQDETSSDKISVGKSLDETLLQLRNKDGELVSEGKGEIFIGSTTRICFVNNEKPNELNKSVFRETGDIAKRNNSGLFLIGRKNKVIKRFGHRINLSKIESTIFKVTNLENKCIWSKANYKILTFILIKDLDVTAKKKTLDKIRAKLITTLPEESFPDFIEIVQNIPLTSHGKVDESALETLYFTPKTELNIANTFSNLWCKYFGISAEQLNALKNYNFFEMGGTSIGAIQFIKELEEIGNFNCSDEIYKNIFENNLEECLECLKNFEPTRKRCSEIIVDDPVRKKEKLVDGLGILWSHDLKACVDGSPLIFEQEGSVYVSVGSFSNIFVVLNNMGKIVHKLVLPEPIEGTPSITSCGKILIGCSNGVMYCIDFLSKHIVWEYKTNGKIKVTAYYSKVQSTVIFGSYDRHVYCVSANNGNLSWKTLLDGSVASNPIYDENSMKIFTAATAGTCFCLAEKTGDIIWKYRCGGPVFGTPCFINSNEGIVFPVVQGVLYCLSKNGELLWKFQIKDHIFSSLVYYKDCIVFGCHDKNIYVTRVSLSECVVIDKIKLGSEISTTPYVCDINNKDIIVAASNFGIIYVIDFRTCDIICKLQLKGEVFSSPSVHEDKIYVGCRDNNLHCIKINFPE